MAELMQETSAEVHHPVLTSTSNPILTSTSNPASAYPGKSSGEYVCGWAAAFINVAATFPINKVMFRQMLHGVGTLRAVQQLQVEGLRHLYRGCLPPLVQKTFSVSLMFGTYSTYGGMLQNTFPFVSTPLTLATAAILAGTTEAILTPLERVQTLLQDRYFNNKFRNSYHVVIELRKYGLKEYYRGLTPILIRNGLSNVLFFSLKGTVKDVLPETEKWWGHVAEDFVSGSLVGAFISTVFYPVNVVKTKMQVCCGGRFVSFSEAFRLTYIERDCSIRKMFVGVHINYTRAFLSWGIINASYELLMKLFFRNSVS